MPDELIIEAGRTEKNYWKDLWRYRELFYILSWRDIKVRYKQTVIGAAWSVIRPLLTMLIFTVVFHFFARMKAPAGVPYPVLVFAGQLPWLFFANALGEASNSLIGNSNLISKVYFPRMIIPSASVITSCIDFLISFALLCVMFLWFQFMPDWKIVFMPVFLLLAFVASMGIGLYITALNVKYRDFRYIVPFIIQFGLYVSPVGYDISIVPEKYRLIYSLNPMVGIIEGFRWCIIGQSAGFNLTTIGLSVAISLFFLFLGIRQFRKMEKTFADLI
jgi:lipopolysaccharide transport system permease protein